MNPPRIYFKRWSNTAVILTGVFITFSCQARLGETVAQIFARYGAVQWRNSQSQGTNNWVGYYHFKDYQIAVTYRGGKSVTELVIPDPKREFDQTEVDTLKQKIGGDGEWKSVGLDEAVWGKSWTNSVNGAWAVMETDQTTLTISTAAEVERGRREFEKQDAQDKEKKKERSSGF